MPTRIQTQDAKLRRRYTGGESMLSIANSLGVSRSTVRRRLLDLGVELRGDGGPNRSRAEARAASPGLAKALDHLAATHAAVKAATAERVLAVAAVVAKGGTWEQIGAQVEQAPPNAWNKYKDLIEKTTTTEVRVRAPKR